MNELSELSILSQLNELSIIEQARRCFTAQLTEKEESRIVINSKFNKGLLATERFRNHDRRKSVDCQSGRRVEIRGTSTRKKPHVRRRKEECNG